MSEAIDLPSWLESLGLQRLVGAFEENGVDGDIVLDLEDGDLRELGLNLGDRKRLLRAIAAVRGEQAAAPSPAPEPTAPAPDAEPEPQPQPLKSVRRPRGEAERRQLTVMFVDLVGSTALSNRLDPEEMSAVIKRYQDAISVEVERYSGHIARFMGDGALCYFGWPVAHEDAAARAVLTALAITSSVAGLTVGGEVLACRVGIATGLVVVGDLVGAEGAQEETVVGDTPNLAARLQTEAKPGQVLVAGETWRLLNGAFEANRLAPRPLKGFRQPVTMYEVTGEIGHQIRFDGRAGLDLGAMEGRDQELALLCERWENSKSGEGQAVLLVGEAGIGKSRISRALLDRISGEDHVRVRYQCSPHHGDTPLWPVTEHLAQACGYGPDDAPAAKLDALVRLLADNATLEDEQISLFADLLGLDHAGRYPRLEMTPQSRREATFEALIGLLSALAGHAPLIVHLEDAHWIDPTTLELISHTLDRIAEKPVMMLITTRPDNQPRLAAHPHVTRLTLNRLGRAGVEKIVRRLGGERLPVETIDAIIERTDGVPLYVEELTKALVEDGQAHVPASLYDTLMARLDRIPEVKAVAQIASVIGREFDHELLAAVAGLDESALRDALVQLQSVELVFRRGGVAAGRYMFKHALVRDAAYESLLKSRRREIHQTIYHALEAGQRTLPELLAHHASRAGMVSEAVRHARRAAEAALERPAYAEALTHLEMALRSLDELMRGRELARERSEILLLAGQARIAHLGYAAKDTISNFAAVETIARDIDDRSLLISGLYGKWAGAYVPGDFPVALTIAEQIHEEAGRLPDDDLPSVLGQRLRGTVLTMMGRLDKAEEALRAAEALHVPTRHRAEAARFGQEVGIAARCYMTGVHAVLGRVSEARALAERVRAETAEVDHVHTTGYALAHVAYYVALADERPLGAELAEDCIAVAADNRMPLWEALARGTLAVTELQAGRLPTALASFESAMEDLGALAFGSFRTPLLPHFALALSRSGARDAARARIEEARELSQRYDARFAFAEVERIAGRIELDAGDAQEAERLFERAHSFAETAGHRTWALRAALDLARLRCETGGEEGRHSAAALLRPFLPKGDAPVAERSTDVVSAVDLARELA